MRRLRAGLILGGSLVIAQGLASQASVQARPGTAQSLEYQVKAAYLLNFTRYIEWPSGIDRKSTRLNSSHSSPSRMPSSA